MPGVVTAIAELRAHAEAFEKNNDPDAREALLRDARSLIARLETPNEFISRTCWAEPARNAAMRIAVDSGLLEHLASRPPGGQGASCAELAKVINAGEAEFVARLLRHLAAMDVIDEVEAGKFEATPVARELAQPKFMGGLVSCMDSLGPAFLALPRFAKELGWKDSTEVCGAAFQMAVKTNKGFYRWILEEEPAIGTAFHNFMTGYRYGIPKWFAQGFYPVENRLGHESLSSSGSVLLVDCAGGKGADIEEFCRLNPSIPGRIILEDVPAVIKAAKQSGTLDEKIECIPFDIFEPQPIRGARAYHLHSILHNWPEKECHTILENIKDAMIPGFSKLLIFEIVIPEIGAKWTFSSLDLSMNVLFSAKERTRLQWVKLLEPHGMVISGIWSVPGGEESLIEVEIAQ